MIRFHFIESGRWCTLSNSNFALYNSASLSKGEEALRVVLGFAVLFTMQWTSICTCPSAYSYHSCVSSCRVPHTAHRINNIIVHINTCALFRWTQVIHFVLLQGAIHATPHQQHHCAHQHAHAAAICGVFPAVPHLVVGRQDTQLLQLCFGMARVATHAGMHLEHAVHAMHNHIPNWWQHGIVFLLCLILWWGFKFLQILNAS